MARPPTREHTHSVISMSQNNGTLSATDAVRVVRDHVVDEAFEL
jgi:hypothetical protein